MNLLKKTLSILLIAGVALAGTVDFKPKLRPPAEKYPTVAINPNDIAKDKAKGTIYLNPAQREQDRIVIHDGLVYSSQGGKYPDTFNTTARHINHFNYVMDSDGNFYLFNEYATPLIRHSSIFDGGPVAGAGEIVIKDQHVVFIDSDSGHYNTKQLMPDVYAELTSDGVNVSQLQH